MEFYFILSDHTIVTSCLLKLATINDPDSSTVSVQIYVMPLVREEYVLKRMQ